ncbi:acyl-CoA carboxylase subunit epsilon [Streptomyces sp. NPDC048441]|uniref:acyl-CoA carboxylase subunit epsilon n=1 Tax=Streptomyces sp. NPDC048441 TaxID=3365552 RepID=UPI003719A1A8
MGDADGPPVTLRIVRGAPDADELAALTAVLNSLTRAAVRTVVSRPTTRRADWHRSRRPGYGAPGSWRRP